MAVSIETLLDVDSLSIEEVTGRLMAVEERTEVSGAIIEQLLLTEEEWVAWLKARKQGENSTRKQSSDSGNKRRNNRSRKKGEGMSQNVQGSGRDKSQDVCRNCNEKGHWARDCKQLKNEAKANLDHEEFT